MLFALFLFLHLFAFVSILPYEGMIFRRVISLPAQSKQSFLTILISTEQSRSLVQAPHARATHLILWSLQEYSKRLSKNMGNTSVRLMSATVGRDVGFFGYNYQRRKPN